MLSIRPAILLSLTVILGACQEECERGDLGCNELANKSEYSLLQAEEFRLRDKPHTQRFLIIRNALDSGQTVIGFPKSASERGYVVLLADWEVPSKDKSVPDEGFTVSADALVALQKEVRLSPEVERYISTMAHRSAD
ncbi:hypothetical protein AAG612_09370 [Citromicrobium bathyomarinum]|uniref:hypothetical protein n=1 Tax=Citromicrobium bathyomarinum TaxID=72174 RepID=UPI00315A1F82